MLNTDRDRLAQTLGLKKLEARYGFARVSGVVNDEFLNGVDIAHGGFLFSLADYAAALASNTEDRAAISSAASINYLSPTPVGTTLTAEATVAAEDSKTAVCNVKIANDGKIVAIFQSRVIFKLLNK